jgi:LuxR family maltose regulon positive regulatory protein
VLRLVAEGLTDPQIAARLFVSRNTVNSHTKAIYGKLGVTNRAAAGRLATEHGLA